MASQLIKEQQDARRFAAIRINDNTAFGRALMEAEVRRVELAVQVEDMVFDYFGIIAVQYEMANGEYGKDVQFQTDKLVAQNKMAKEIIKSNPKDEELTDDKCKELSKRISDFTMTLMKGLGTTDPKTGKTLFDPAAASEKGFDIMLQMEKDKFFMDTGYTSDAVTKRMKIQREETKQAEFVAMQNRMVAGRAAKDAGDEAGMQAAAMGVEGTDGKASVTKQVE